MNTHYDQMRTSLEHLLGKYLLIAGEIDMFITLSKSFFTGNEVSKTWVKKELADKLKWYKNNLDQSVPEHASLVYSINAFDITHRPFRNTLAHSGLTLNVSNNAFEVMNADGLSDSISLKDLQQKVVELNQLKQDINERIALSASAHIKSTRSNP
ncbi:hypothetical protein D3C72_1245260 [compost metagenome]